MTEAEKQTVLLHLNSKPRWLARLAMMILRDKVLAEGKRYLEADFRGATVEVLKVEVERYAIGEETMDEGPIYWFELGSNQLLVLWGQWLCDPHVVATELLDLDELWERSIWFKHFELVRAPASGLVFSLTGIGRETVSSVGTIGAGQRLPPLPSELCQGSLDALLNEGRGVPHKR